MNSDYRCDLFRYYGRYNQTFKEKICEPLSLKYIFYLRKVQSSSGLLKILYKYCLMRLSRKTNIEISPSVKIGKGFFIMHAGGVIMHPEVQIGKYVNINSGAVIGAEFRGKRAGVPTVGDYCYIGKNAAVVGKITIGDDVLIAPCAYVNFDVPSHSIVLGNPGRIIPKERATAGYIYNIPEEDDCG